MLRTGPWRLAALAACLLLAACQSTVPSASTAPSTRSNGSQTASSGLGQLAYIEGGDVWVKALPDGQPQRLTHDGLSSSPSWSPSGGWLAYEHAATDTVRRLWVMRASGADAHQLGPVATAAAWSPAADRIAYVSGGALKVANADGSGSEDLTPASPVAGNGAGSPAWSPDGSQIAFSTIQRAFGPAASQHVSAEGQPLPFATVSVVSADGGQPRELVNGGKPSTEGFVVAGWSPDGQYVLYWEDEQFSASLLADDTTLMAVPVAGGSPVQVSKQMLARPDFLDWAPDGQMMALIEGGSRFTTQNKTLAVTTIGGAAKLLGASNVVDLFPAWSPDRPSIAVSSMPASKDSVEPPGSSPRHIWLVAADGSGRRQLTSDASFSDQRPQWSTDGRHLLFARVNGEQSSVWLMNADGSGQRQVVPELTPDPAAASFYGYIDWSRGYAWWTGSPRSNSAAGQ